MVGHDTKDRGKQVLVSIGLRYITPDCFAAGQQAIGVFETNLREAALRIPTPEKVREVSFFLSFFNPLMRIGDEAAPVAEFSLKQKVYFAPGSMTYEDYLQPDWSARIEGVYRVAVEALDATSRFALPAQLKEELLVALRVAADASHSQPPRR